MINKNETTTFSNEEIIISGIINYFKINKKDEVWEYTDIYNYSKKYHPILETLFKHSFVNPKDFNFNFKENVSIEEIKYYLNRFLEEKDNAAIKKLKTSLSTINTLKDVDKIIEEFKYKKVDNLETKLVQNNNFLKTFTQYQGLEVLGHQIGLKELDEKTDGIFGLTGITGEPGTGKTTLAIQTAYNNAFIFNKPVIYLTLEVPKDMFMAKMASFMTSIPTKKILKESLLFDESTKKYHAILQLNNNNNLYIFDKKDRLSFLKLTSIINEVEKKHNTKPLVIIDYFNLFKDPAINAMKIKGLEAEEMTMSEFIDLKNETQANFILIMQKNKAGYKSNDMSSLKGSNASEYGLETIISLSNPSDIGLSLVKEANVVASLMKNRWGEAKVFVPLQFKKDISKFFELS
jgi:replicative DNA helicase